MIGEIVLGRRAVWGAGVSADWGAVEVLMAVRENHFKIDGRAPGGMQFGVLAQVLFWGVAVRAHLCQPGVLGLVASRIKEDQRSLGEALVP